MAALASRGKRCDTGRGAVPVGHVARSDRAPELPPQGAARAPQSDKHATNTPEGRFRAAHPRSGPILTRAGGTAPAARGRPRARACASWRARRSPGCASFLPQTYLRPRPAQSAWSRARRRGDGASSCLNRRLRPCHAAWPRRRPPPPTVRRPSWYHRLRWNRSRWPRRGAGPTVAAASWFGFRTPFRPLLRRSNPMDAAAAAGKNAAPYVSGAVQSAGGRQAGAAKWRCRGEFEQSP